MNWYKESAWQQKDPEAVLSDDGKTLLIYNSYMIKDQLKSLISQKGYPIFTWRPQLTGKPWGAPFYLIKNDQSIINFLEGIGVPLDNLLSNQAPNYNDKNDYPSEVKEEDIKNEKEIQQHISKWVLGRVVDLEREKTGQPVVLAEIYTYQGPLGWVWQNRDGNMGIVRSRDFLNQIEFLPDKNNPLSSKNPSELFVKFDEMYQIEEDEEADKTEQELLDEEDVDKDEENKGRIPEDKISIYQKQIQDTFTETNKGIVIDALAGTGKTTTLRHIASFKKPNEKWLYLVFGKLNQKEASEKFPSGVQVLTSHSFLGRILSNNSKNNIIPETSLEFNKMHKLIDEYVDSFPKKILYSAKVAIYKICSLAKNSAIDPRQNNVKMKILELIDKYAIDVSDFSSDNNNSINYIDNIVDECINILNYSLPGGSPDDKYNLIRDHDDTLWYSALTPDLNWPFFDVVLVDEVQDFNRCQTIMLQRLSERGARIIAVGDPNQAIYMFRGADSDAFDRVQSLVNSSPNGGQNHQIPVNYRCGKKIIEYVNNHSVVNNLQAGRDYEGKVTEGQPAYDALSSLSAEWQKNGKLLNQQTGIIGRTNKPLVSAALQLLKNNVDFKIVGRDLSKELTDLVTKVSTHSAIKNGIRGPKVRYHSVNIRDFINELSDYVVLMRQKWSGKTSKADELNDLVNTAESLTNIYDLLVYSNFSDPNGNIKNISNSKDFVLYLRSRFGGADEGSFEDENKDKDPRSYVTLTSAHRSKGLEFSRVYIIDPDNFPSPKAETEDQLRQEENAWYVALTRAMDELHILKPEKHLDA